jgi:hypothetical protein
MATTSTQPLDNLQPVSPAAYLASILIAIIVGIGIGIVSDKYLPSSISNTKKGYNLGYSTAKTMVDKSTFGKYLTAQRNNRTLSGTITGVSGNTITMRTVTEDPFMDPALINRTILLTSSTSLTFISAGKMTKTSSGASVPTFEKQTIKPADIRVGDSVGVFLAAETTSAPQPTALTLQILPRTTGAQK